MKYLDDIELLKNFRDRRNDVLSEIYNRYSHLVYGVCLKYLESRDESLDTVVEIFESLFEKIPAHTITNLKSWLYSVTKNHCLMKIRKTKKQEEALYRHYFYKKEYYNPDTSENELTFNIKIETALAQLTNEQKICIEMFYYENKSYNEISDETGFPIKSVKSYLQNGKIKLKKIMEDTI